MGSGPRRLLSLAGSGVWWLRFKSCLWSMSICSTSSKTHCNEGARLQTTLSGAPGCLHSVLWRAEEKLAPLLTRFSSDSVAVFSSANTTLLLLVLFLDLRSLTSGRVLPGEMGSSSTLGVLGAADSRSKLKGRESANCGYSFSEQPGRGTGGLRGPSCWLSCYCRADQLPW